MAYLFWWTKPNGLRSSTTVRIEADHRLHFVLPQQSSTDRAPSRLKSSFQDLIFYEESSLGDHTTASDAVANVRQLSLMSVLCLAFSGVHIAAWNYPFPSETEAWLWRSSAIVTGIAPCWFFWLGKIESHAFYIEFKRPWQEISILLVTITVVVLYYVSRVFLIVETFASLRSAPSGIYKQLNWSSFIGHSGS